MEETWRAMEGLVKDGLVKNIGICNMTCTMMREILNFCEIKPSVLQVELHPYLTQEKLLRFCKEKEIAVTGFSNLGSQSYVGIGMATKSDSVLDQQCVIDIAAKHNKSAAQVVLRWGVQRGHAIIPRTSKVERMPQNLNLFDFTLADDEMAAISALN